MKKGQKIRILKDNSIGTIADSTFFTLGCKKYIRYEVRKKGEQEGHWFPAEELGPVVEVLKMTVDGSNGQQLFANLNIDYGKSTMAIQLTGNPKNLKDHTGTHLRVMNAILSSFKNDF